jgi:hypothetical protein
MNSCCICWVFKHIFTGIVIFKGPTARRLYKSFEIKGLTVEIEEWRSLLCGGPEKGHFLITAIDPYVYVSAAFTLGRLSDPEMA